MPVPVRTSPSAANCIASARAKSSGVGDLDVAGLAGEHRDFHAGPFGERGVVGEIVAASRGGAAVRVEQRREGEALRRLHQRAACRGRASCRRGRAASTRLDRVGHRQRRDRRAGSLRPPRSRATTSAALANGRAASWISTMSGLRAAQRLEAGAHRGLPGRAAKDRRQADRDAGRRSVGKGATSSG